MSAGQNVGDHQPNFLTHTNLSQTYQEIRAPEMDSDAAFFDNQKTAGFLVPHESTNTSLRMLAGVGDGGGGKSALAVKLHRYFLLQYQNEEAHST